MEEDCGLWNSLNNKIPLSSCATTSLAILQLSAMSSLMWTPHAEWFFISVSHTSLLIPKFFRNFDTVLISPLLTSIGSVIKSNLNSLWIENAICIQKKNYGD
ncbi:uncharacterized protein ACOB8E_000386 [Sarcophilus harrisii]